jgi:hypothetical protein
MTIFETAFNQAWEAMPSARAQIRVGKRDEIAKALCAGLDQLREASEQGPFDHVPVKVRCLATEETDKIKLPIGAVIEVSTVTPVVWTELRIAGRADRAGIIILTMEDPNE